MTIVIVIHTTSTQTLHKYWRWRASRKITYQISLNHRVWFAQFAKIRGQPQMPDRLVEWGGGYHYTHAEMCYHDLLLARFARTSTGQMHGYCFRFHWNFTRDARCSSALEYLNIIEYTTFGDGPETSYAARHILWPQQKLSPLLPQTQATSLTAECVCSSKKLVINSVLCTSLSRCMHFQGYPIQMHLLEWLGGAFSGRALWWEFSPKKIHSPQTAADRTIDFGLCMHATLLSGPACIHASMYAADIHNSWCGMVIVVSLCRAHVVVSLCRALHRFKCFRSPECANACAQVIFSSVIFSSLV